MTHEPADDLALIIAAAQDAGRLAMTYFGGVVPIVLKPDGSPVTAADTALDALLHGALMGARPDYGWLSEESPDDARRLGCRRCFIVDPIDGTSSFARGIPEFTVCIGLSDGVEAIAGVVHNPAKGETFAALRGGGATLNGQPIHTTARTALAGATVIAGQTIKRPEFAGAFAEARTLWVNSIAYRMVNVACGRADATLSLTLKSEWDVCAASLIVEEAGGRCTDLSGARYRFNQPSPRVDGPIAAGAALYDAVRAAVAAREESPA